MDFLMEAWALVRRNGGSAGVDGETIEEVKQGGVEEWLGELLRELREGTYRPKAVRQVLIPKKQPGKFRPFAAALAKKPIAGMSGWTRKRWYAV